LITPDEAEDSHSENLCISPTARRAINDLDGYTWDGRQLQASPRLTVTAVQWKA